VDVDRQGRVNLPANLRSFAGIERDAVLISLADRVEIWDEQRLDAWMKAQFSGGAGA
jgi:MraZ protein